jgi:hypothetical protein
MKFMTCFNVRSVYGCISWIQATRLAYTGLLGGLEHLKIETRLIDEMFASVMGEYVFLK